MTPTTPNQDLLDLAHRLLVYEGARNSSGENTPAAFLVGEKLRRPLSRLVGTVGFRSLLARTLTLAKGKVPALSEVRIRPDGSLDGLSAIADQVQATEAGGMLIAQLLALLVLFVGERLVLNLVLDVWPDLPASKHPPLENTHL